MPYLVASCRVGQIDDLHSAVHLDTVLLPFSGLSGENPVENSKSHDMDSINRSP